MMMSSPFDQRFAKIASDTVLDRSTAACYHARMRHIKPLHFGLVALIAIAAITLVVSQFGKNRTTIPEINLNPKPVTIRVLDPDDRPLAGATVTVRQFGSVESLETDANGMVQLDHLLPFDSVTIQKEGYLNRAMEQGDGNRVYMLRLTAIDHDLYAWVPPDP